MDDQRTLNEVFIIGDPHAHGDEMLSLLEQSGIGKVLTEKEAISLSDDERKKVISFETDDGSRIHLQGLKDDLDLIILGDLTEVGSRPLGVVNLLDAIKQNPLFGARLTLIKGNHDRGHESMFHQHDHVDSHLSDAEYEKRYLRMLRSGRSAAYSGRHSEDNRGHYLKAAHTPSQLGMDGYIKMMKLLQGGVTSLEFTMRGKHYILAHSIHIDPRLPMEQQNPLLLTSFTPYSQALQNELGKNFFLQIPQANETLVVGHQGRAYQVFKELEKNDPEKADEFKKEYVGKPYTEDGANPDSRIIFLDTVMDGRLSGLLIASPENFRPATETFFHANVNTTQRKKELAGYQFEIVGHPRWNPRWSDARKRRFLKRQGVETPEGICGEELNTFIQQNIRPNQDHFGTGGYWKSEKNGFTHTQWHPLRSGNEQGEQTIKNQVSGEDIVKPPQGVFPAGTGIGHVNLNKLPQASSQSL